MIELRGITWRHPRGFDSVVGAAAAYRSVEPDVEIRWEARSLQAFADQPIEELCRSHDLLVIDHPHVAHASRAGLLLPLDGLGFDAALAASFVGPSHDSYQVGGRQLALAIDAAAQVAVVRPDVLDSPPETWDDVLELARDGGVLWPTKPIDAYSSLLTIAASMGHPAFQAAPFLDHGTGMAALELMIRLARLVPAECLQHDPIDTAEWLATSDRWLYAPLVFGYTNYSRPDFRAHRLRYLDAPSGPGGRAALLGGAGVAVSAASPRRDAAVAHAFWLASGATQRGPYFAAGGQPAHVEAWDDAALDAETLGFFSGTRRTLDSAWVRPQRGRYVEFQDRVAPLVTRVLAGTLDPAAFLTDADRLASALLADEASQSCRR